MLVIWVGFHLSGRVSARGDFTPWDVAALRYTGAFLTALPLALWRGWPRIAPARLGAVLATAAAGFPIGAYLGFSLAPAAHGAVILAGALPVVAAVLTALFLGERWTGRRIASLAVIAGGVGLLFADGAGWHPGAWLGDLAFFAAATAWAGYTVLVRRWTLRALEVTLAVGLCMAPLYLPVWWFALPSNLGSVPPGAALGLMVYHGTIAVVVAGFLYTTAVNALGPGPTTMVGAAVPALVALLAWPLLGEPLGPAGAAGVALASLGMVLGVVGGRPR